MISWCWLRFQGRGGRFLKNTDEEEEPRKEAEKLNRGIGGGPGAHGIPERRFQEGESA